MPSFQGLDTPKGVAELNKFLADHSYIEGYVASSADVEVYKQLKTAPDASKAPHVARWYEHISFFPEATRNGWSATNASAAATTSAPSSAGAADAEKKAEDDFDLFADDDDEEHEKEIERRAQEQLARTAAKQQAQGVVMKSAVLIDVKPWEDTTDLVEMERLVRSIEMEGLEWKASKLVPIGYGIKKLSISCHVVDAIVSVDDIQEKIAEFEDLVQSTDVITFTKL